MTKILNRTETRYTKQRRQEIVEAFCRKNGGRFDARKFARDASDPNHPAHDWFEWDDRRAAESYRVEQARKFVRDLRVSFEIKRIVRGCVRVDLVKAPLAISSREDQDGYSMTDPDDPDSMRKYRREAATALRNWISRYEGAAAHAGASVGPLRRVLRVLES